MGAGINNDVFQILVTKDNQAILPADQPLEALQPGQVGIFSYTTNLSIDGTDKVTARDFYIAVGVDNDNDGVTDDILTSAGTHIQPRNLRAYTLRCYTPSQPKVVELTDFKANCETEYAIKIEFRNGRIYRNFGYNQLAKTFPVVTSCCEECVDCPSGDCIQLAVDVRDAINADPDGLLIAEVIDGPGGAVLADDAAIEAFRTANTDAEGVITACPGVRMTAQSDAISQFCNVNLQYFKIRETDIIVSLLDGFECNGTITTTQDIIHEEGAGYDLAQLDYEAGGWNGQPGPYRLNTLAGVAVGPFPNQVDQNEKYVQINLSYEQFSTTGWQSFENSQNTTIAIPVADTTTRDEVIGVLDAILDLNSMAFGGLAAIAANCPSDTTTINTTPDATGYGGGNAGG